MSERRGLVFYTCGHQEPIPSKPDRHVDGPCSSCRQAASPLEISRRKTFTLQMLYRGLYTECPSAWVACAACGALYPDPSDLSDCHRCPVSPC